MEDKPLSIKKLSILMLPLLFYIIFSHLIDMKPDRVDFKNWLESEYDFDCRNYRCDVFHLEMENSEKKKIAMYATEDNYSPGIFTMTREMKFKNYDNDNYRFYFKVKGFNGDIEVLEEINVF